MFDEVIVGFGGHGGACHGAYACGKAALTPTESPKLDQRLPNVY